ncbi:MAG: TetR/AcrR family transcriptional regulator [Dysgonamonadaceae bacterium]|jgi:AcrR family transcriptional regulator|nr:TetR/AcrR family transcriptional regulator [Dysgonamonadaceae bacterium]
MNLRERIVEEASLLFFRNGIKSVTMSDIAKHLGISKRTLYENFADKETLLEECLHMNADKAKGGMKKLIETSENVIDAMMRIYEKQLNDMNKVNKSAVYDLRKYHPKLYKIIDCEQREERVSAFLPLFEKGVEQGLVRDDIDFEILLWLLKAQFKMLLETDFIPVDKFSIQQFIEAIILNFTRGIATAKGNKKIDEILKKK